MEEIFQHAPRQAGDLPTQLVALRPDRPPLVHRHRASHFETKKLVVAVEL